MSRLLTGVPEITSFATGQSSVTSRNVKSIEINKFYIRMIIFRKNVQKGKKEGQKIVKNIDIY